MTRGKTIVLSVAGTLAALAAIGGSVAAGSALASSHAAAQPVAATAPAPQPTKTIIKKVHPKHHHHAAPPAEASAPALPASPQAPQPQFTNASAVVEQYYQDITDGNYTAAWDIGGSNLNGGTGYSEWVAGYDTTVSVTLSDESVWGSGQVHADLTALQSDGSVKTYTGTYAVSGGQIVGADIVQTG
jgi:hypothetical protein